MAEMVLLAHSAKWDLENLGGVRIKLSMLCVRSSEKRPACRGTHRKYQECRTSPLRGPQTVCVILNKSLSQTDCES